MFGKKSPAQEPKVEPDTDYVGFRYGSKSEAPPGQEDRAYGLTASERVHMAIFGLPGCGKSSILKLLCYQNIQKNQGFTVIDPHGELARDVMGMVPPERQGDIIYVNPGALYRFGRCIQINPLDARHENERYVVVMAFVNVLYNLYRDSWGPRLETVLRNAANALVESPGHNSLGNISAMITDEGARREILRRVASKSVRHFWTEIFAKQYSRDAGSAAYNKIDKILATPTVAAMFDCTESSVDVADIIRNKRMLIVDLSTGASDDIARFLGSIFLNAIYVEAKKRIDSGGDLAEARSNPHYVYIDEAHMFSNHTMSEMLRTLRKFGVKVALATQTCNAYEREFADEIPGVCKTLITGKCDFNTARLLRSVMPAGTEEMQRLPNHTFVMSTDEGGVPASATFRARPVPFAGSDVHDWADAARKSVEKWGVEADIEKYAPTKSSGVLFEPVEALIVHLLHFDARDWFREQLIEAAGMVFPGIRQRSVSLAAERLAREGYVAVRYPDAGGHSLKKRYVIAEKAYSLYLTQAAGGRRGGGDDHQDVVNRIMDRNMKRHRYCIPDLGEGGPNMADLSVVEPAITRDADGGLSYDPHRWSERSLAVEVETAPKKHMAHSVKNYTKSAGPGRFVWFVCFESDGRRRLEREIRRKHPEPAGLLMDVIEYPEVALGTQEIPCTEEGAFTDTGAPGIQEICRMIADSEALSHGRGSLAEQAADAHKSSKKNIEGTPVPGTGGHKGVSHVTAAGRVRMTSLEYSVYSVVRAHGGFAADTKKIAEKLGGNVSVRGIYGAIRGLVDKGVLVWGEASYRHEEGSLDGRGTKRSTRMKKTLELAEQKPWPPRDGPGDSGGAPLDLSSMDSGMLAFALADPAVGEEQRARVREELARRG
ncbi:ATPase [Cenarchaeum symbiosum A]|uniref:ATPase n=1 Tax=Cenarchaeum symbiosum (strain A) TaxID=414004 RepID=A0RVG1_CENSY|nr:ATPase [Cenarchaeum symbiosum A]